MKTLVLLISILSVLHTNAEGKSIQRVVVRPAAYYGATNGGTEALLIILKKDGTGLRYSTPATYDVTVVTAYRFTWAQDGQTTRLLIRNIHGISKLNPDVKSVHMQWEGSRLLVKEVGSDWKQDATLYERTSHQKAQRRLEHYELRTRK